MMTHAAKLNRRRIVPMRGARASIISKCTAKVAIGLIQYSWTSYSSGSEEVVSKGPRSSVSIEYVSLAVLVCEQKLTSEIF
jgi:hypothetical protein